MINGRYSPSPSWFGKYPFPNWESNAREPVEWLLQFADRIAQFLWRTSKMSLKSPRHPQLVTWSVSVGPGLLLYNEGLSTLIAWWYRYRSVRSLQNLAFGIQEQMSTRGNVDLEKELQFLDKSSGFSMHIIESDGNGKFWAKRITNSVYVNSL